jgi:hypothetical protein
VKTTQRNGLRKMPDKFNDYPKIIIYKGVNIDTMSKEELIGVIQEIIEMYETELKREVHARKFQYELMNGK